MDDLKSNFTPLISVVMSVFNEPVGYLNDAIQSIIKQTYQNLEFIVLLDNPNNISAKKMIEEFAIKDSRIVFLKNTENIGLARSLNKGIGLVKGEYIARMDADDIALPQRFEKQLEWLHKTGADICGTPALSFNELSSSKYNVHTGDLEIKTELLFGSALIHPTVMGKVEIFKENLYNEEYACAQDYHMWVNLALKGIKMTNCPEILLKYRIHNKQTSQRKKKEQQQNHNKIVLYYWRTLGMELDNNNISNANDYKQMINSLANKGMINSVSIHHLWVRAVKSCNLGLGLWRAFISIEQVNILSFKSTSLFLFCLLKNQQFPLKLKKLSWL